MSKTFALAEVKAIADSESAFGEFEAILSAPTLDRDGEVIDAKAFEPLPASIPVHAFHDFHDPIGRGVPSYEGDVLVLRGKFASTPRAQEIRALVAEGVIANMSVGFMSAERELKDGVPHVTEGEILEGSFVSIPSNRESAVLMAKHYEAKAGARNSSSDAARLQEIHDLAVANGATCETKSVAVAGDALTKQHSIAVRVPMVGERIVVDPDRAHDPAHTTGTIAEIGTTAYGVVMDAMPEMGVHRWYTADEFDFVEDLEAVPSTGMAEKSTTTDPEEKAAARAAAEPPADVAVARARAELLLGDALLSLD